MEITNNESNLIQPPGTEPRPTPRPRSKPSTPVGPAQTGPSGHLLGADGRELPEPPAGGLSKLSAPILGFAERNPKGAALLSLGVGLVAGAILGVVVKRD